MSRNVTQVISRGISPLPNSTRSLRNKKQPPVNYSQSNASRGGADEDWDTSEPMHFQPTNMQPPPPPPNRWNNNKTPSYEPASKTPNYQPNKTPSHVTNDDDDDWDDEPARNAPIQPTRDG